MARRANDKAVAVWRAFEASPLFLKPVICSGGIFGKHWIYNARRRADFNNPPHPIASNIDLRQTIDLGRFLREG